MGDTPQPSRLAARVAAGRRTRFIGRSAELTAFREALEGGDRRVLLVHGRAGSGKTTLLEEFARISAETGHRFLRLNGGDLRPRGEEAGLGGEGEQPSLQDLVRLLHSAALPRVHRDLPSVLLIDDGDGIQDLLRATVLPGLPDSVVVVVATRDEPAQEWHTDLGWDAVTRTLPLRWFEQGEAMEFLRRLGVPPAKARWLTTHTEGHPLSLALVSRNPSAIRTLALARDHALIGSLLDALVGQPPDQACRDSLFVCAHAESTTQETLRQVLGTAEVDAAWGWLRSVGPVVTGPFGLRMTPLARDLVEAGQLRDAPDRWMSLHAAIHRISRDHLLAGAAPCGSLPTLRNLFSGHPTAALSCLWRSRELNEILPRRATGRGFPVALDLVERSVGPEVAEIAHRWAHEQPQHLIVGDVDGTIHAAALTVRISVEQASACSDPHVRACTGLLSSAYALRPEDRVTFLRTVSDLEGSPNSDVAVYIGIIALVIQWFAHRTDVTAVPDPGHQTWRGVLADLGLAPLPGALPDGRRLYAFDFRRFPPDRWLDYLVRHDMSAAGGLPADLLRPPPLTYPQFAKAVKDALRDLHRPVALATNPLAEGLLPGGSSLARGEALRRQVTAACSVLRGSERDKALLRVLDVSYLRPAGTQREAAKALYLPLGTFRRHHGLAVQRITDLLWNHENGNGVLDPATGGLDLGPWPEADSDPALRDAAP